MFNLQIEPLVGGLLAELTSASAIVIIGILAEKEVDKMSVLVNIFGLFLMLVTTGLNLLMLPLLLFYLFFGIIVYRKRWDKAYFFFSSKTYGCLMFATIILHSPSTQEYLSTIVQPSLPTIGSIISSIIMLLFASTALVVSCWFILIPFVYALGYIYKKRRHL